MKRIALMNCYFGKFPWYFPFFIKSCVTNPTIDFIIFSNAFYTDTLPANVRIIPLDLSAFNLWASEKLGFEISLKNAYKLCDFKPAYGVIFSEYLKEYDFWGMCDIDIILGRIREFMTDELLYEYDVINTRHDYLTGSFMLFRNNEVCNNLFAKSKDYKKVFISDKHFCFDECNFKHAQMENEMNIFDVDCEIESMEHVIRTEMELGSINVFFDFLVVDGLSGKLKWDNGLLSYSNKLEILLYHLIQYKSNFFSKKETWEDIPNTYFIDKYTFRKKSKKSFRGMYDFFVSNKYFPFISFLFNTGDYFLSKLFNRTPLNILTEGVYKNKLGDTYLFVEKNPAGYDLISSSEYSKIKRKLIGSTLKQKIFFLSNEFLMNFKIFITEDGKTEKIQRMMFDGSVTDYELIK
jgi:hypothetical protein